MDQKLLYHNIFEYDIKSAHPSILKNINYPFKNDWYNLEKKLDKNIYIGKLFRDDQALRVRVNCIVESLIFNYMYKADCVDDVILVLYDAIFIQKYIQDYQIEDFLKKYNILIRLKNKYNLFMIINKRSRKFIGFTTDKCILKGYTKTKNLEQFIFEYLYMKLISSSEKIGKIIYDFEKQFYSYENSELYIILKNEENYIKLKGVDEFVKFENQSVEDVDKEYYMAEYIYPIINTFIIEDFNDNLLKHLR